MIPLPRARRTTVARIPASLRFLLPALVLLAASAGHAGDLRIAAWNLEHLNDTDLEGCVPRRPADYAAIGRQVAALDAHVVAFQEIENVAAAHRIFPPAGWHVEISARPFGGPFDPCRQRPSARLGHLATGFAVRHGTAYRRHPDLTSLGSGDPFERWGTDLSVANGGRELRLLSVHLKTGCWGAPQDADTEREEICTVLRGQLLLLKAWADARRSEGLPFVILGDFNRRLAVPGDWGWRILSPPSAPLRLPTSEAAFACDPRFDEFIDHFVIGGGAEAMFVPGSFREVPREGRHPDHCAMTADFVL